MKRIVLFYLFLVSVSALFSQEFDTITDARDGQEYRIVKIGEQWWMAENLRATHYADGTPITIIESETEWDSLESTAKAYCWYNNDSSTNAKTYGALYTWTGAMNGSASSNLNPSGVQGVCPIGWHIPANDEWTTLVTYLGGGSVAGGKMKSTGTDLWRSKSWHNY